jgi:hypothetical protein
MALQLKAAVRKNNELQLKHESVQEEPNLTLQTAAAQKARSETLDQQITRMHSGAATNHKPKIRNEY